MSDQATEQSVEARLASFFSPGAGDAPVEQPEAAPVEEASASGEPVVEEIDTDEPEQPQEDADSDFEEIDLDGEKYRVPPKLREAVLRQADYTRKTQEVAETARMLQAQQQQMALQAQFQQATAQEWQQLQSLESQLAQYKSLDWGQMDAETLMKARFQMDNLREQAESLRGGLNAKSAQFQQMMAQQRQQQLQQGLEYLRKSIPKFDSDTVANIRNYAINEGFTAPEVDNIADPRLVKLMWKAQQFDAIRSSTKSAVEAVKKAPPVIKPGATKGSNAVAEARYKDMRQRLKKGGDVRDAARLIAMRMK